MKRLLEDIYATLLADGGHQGWWPGDSPFEIAVGAVLTQNTSWTGVEKAVAALKGADLLSAPGILAADPDVIGGLIRPSGYYNLKTMRLKALCGFLIENDAADPTLLDRFDTRHLRRMLLSVNGIGRETADSILLYAVGKPVFVVDAYTRRIFSRLGILEYDRVGRMDYDEIRDFFERHLERSVDLYRDYHAQIVRCAKACCQTRPKCLKCPLTMFCPVPNGELFEHDQHAGS